MDDTGLSILSGVAQGIEKAAQNIYNINIAKQELKQKQEIFNLDKKQKELEIKKAEYILSPEQIQLERDKLKAETSAQTALFNLRGIQMSAEENKQKRELDTHTASMQLVQNFLAGKIKLPKGGGIRIGNTAITGEKGKTATDIATLLGPENSVSQDKTKEVNDYFSQF